MATEQFNDRALINLARYHYYNTKGEPEDALMENLFNKEKLSNSERNTLLSFIAQNKHVKPLSMSQMKAEIFEIVGFKGNHNSHNNTVNRGELEAIHLFLKEKFKETD